MIKITKPESEPKLKALFYSPPGHGKTTLVGTAQLDERTAPLLVLDFEGGSSSLAGLSVDVIRIRTWSEYEEVHAMLRGSNKYRSVAIDSISETYVFAQLHLLAMRKPTVGDPDILQLQEWGKARIQMQRLLRGFRDLPMHVFFTALAKKEVEPREGEVSKPSFTGSLSDEVAGMMDVVAYLALVDRPVLDAGGNPTDRSETVRCLLLHSIPKYRCKVRTQFGVQVPSMLYEPTVGKLLDILGYKKA